MMRFTRGLRRSAFTLVELLVAMGVLVVLASLALLVVPSALDQDRTTDGATLLRQWLMIAKARAVRDQLPRGVRLIVVPDPTNPSKTDPRWVTELQYIEAPPIFLASPSPNAPAMIASAAAGPPTAGAPGTQVILEFSYTTQTGAPNPPALGTITTQQCVLLGPGASPLPGVIPPSMQLQIQADLSSGRFPLLYVPSLVRPDLPGMSGWFQITGFTPPSPPGQHNAILALNTNSPYSFPDLGAATQYVTYGFGIYGAPRPLIGEPTQQLPKSICVDLSASAPGAVPDPNNPGMFLDYDIVFGPNGYVLPTSTGAGVGQYFLWVRDYTKGGGAATLASFQQGGEQQVVSLKARSGSLGVFPLMWPAYGAGQDPFTFARQGATAYGQ